ncbi:reverse transcriptase domain-containing protein [Klebsiella pneumoniae]|uniref:reverse transcriptase domain-containing protein n=1 Tax=Klebsiella pneumoniae TaxID=573 RepID=UPI0040557070
MHKKGSTTECGNYRPISLLSVVYKIYTSILEKRLRRMVEEQLEPEQAGFRPGEGSP